MIGLRLDLGRRVSLALALTLAVAVGTLGSTAVRTANAQAPGEPPTATESPTAPAVTLLNVPSELQGSVELEAEASASTGRTIASVTFESAPAGSGQWAPIATDTSKPFVVAFDTTAIADGATDLRATATDDTGEVGSSPVVSTTVANTVTAPRVTLDDPGLVLRGIVALTASATAAPSRSITAVTFERAQAGSEQWTAVGVDSNPPFVTTLDTTLLEDGAYDFRAVATDSSGATGTSVAVVDRVVANGGVSATLDDPGEYLRGTVTLRATATSPDGVDTVTFERQERGSRSWQTLGTSTQEPFALEIDTTELDDGLYAFRVSATDAARLVGISPPVRARRVDNTPPTASLQVPPSPLRGRVVLAATAQDTDGSGVASVRFERAIAGSETWVAIATDSAAPFSVAFNSSKLQNATYDFRALARDRAGNTGPSATISDRVVENDPEPPQPAPSITSMVVPAHDLTILGSEGVAAERETWAVGFTSAAPAEVAGERLPYTALGNQLVLLRYRQATGWQIADVLRDQAGDAFELLTTDDAQSTLVRGAMTETGEAWVWVAQTAGVGEAPVFGLFHREPDGPFLLDTQATAELDDLLRPVNASAASALRLREGADGPFGILVSPGQEAGSAAVAGDGGTVTVATRLRYGLLEDGAWAVDTAEVPDSYAPRAGDTLELATADAVTPGTGWGAFRINRATPGETTRPLLLGRFDGSGWASRTTDLDALDLTGRFRTPGSVASPTRLRANERSVWIEADVTSGGSGKIVARYDVASLRVVDSWCALPRVSADCTETLDLDRPAAVPDATFETAAGEVGVALQENFVHVFREGEWTRLPAPGYTPFTGGSVFTGPTEGWLAGSDAVGEWTLSPRERPLVAWPQPNRSPLTSVAVAPGSGASLLTSGSGLAVGLDGTALHYDARTGWLVDPVPPRASRVNLFGVAYTSSTTAIAVGQFGVILRWNGTTWTEDPQSISLTQSQLNAVAASPSGEAWAVGTFGTILHFDGSSWKVELPPAEDSGVNITSVAVAGSDVFAVAAGNLLARAEDGSWNRVDPELLPDPAPQAGDLRLVAGLPDGGLVVGGRALVLTRERPGEELRHAAQPVEGIVVALAAMRSAGGEVRAIVSVAPPAVDPFSQQSRRDVAGYPAGDGELLRQTADGSWQDLSLAQYPSRSLPGDGAVKVDPVLAVAASSDGARLWAVGGYAGTVTAAGQGTSAILPARPSGWRTSSIWRWDADARNVPPGLDATPRVVPARNGTVSFAFFSSALCKVQCGATLGAQPDVNLQSAAEQIVRFAEQPGGPSFAVLGGNARGPSTDQARRAGNGAFDFARLPPLLSPLGDLPLYAAYGPLDSIPGRDDPSQPWADSFAGAPAPFGSGAVPSRISPAGAGGRTGNVNRYYAFDASQNGGTVRVIVLDNSAGSLEASAPGQTDWLRGRLDSARTQGVPVVVVTALPLRGDGTQPGLASDAQAVADLLARNGVLAVFTTNGPGQLNERHLVPERPEPGVTQIPEFEGASLGYQQPQNNGVVWYQVSVDSIARQVRVDAIPVIETLSIRALQGLTVARSFTLEFQAIARRPVSSLATTPTDDSFPGFDSYVSIPATSCGGRPCIQPAYTFRSSDPTIGDFVVPSAAGSRFPQLSSDGKTTPSATSGLFCAFNTGSTNVTVTAGLLSYTVPVTVQDGGFGPPCGTVFREGVNPIVVVQQQVNTQSEGNAGAAVPPPPPPPAPVVTPEIPVLQPPAPPPPLPVEPPVAPAPAPPAPAPAPAPPPAPKPIPQPAPPAAAPSPAPAPQAPIALLPPPPPPVQPIPPGGAAVPSSSPAAAPRREKAQKHASQGAYVIRSGGDDASWFFALSGITALGALLLAAAGLRLAPQHRPRPASAIAHSHRRERR